MDLRRKSFELHDHVSIEQALTNLKIEPVEDRLPTGYRPMRYTCFAESGDIRRKPTPLQRQDGKKAHPTVLGVWQHCRQRRYVHMDTRCHEVRQYLSKSFIGNSYHFDSGRLQKLLACEALTQIAGGIAELTRVRASVFDQFCDRFRWHVRRNIERPFEQA